MLRGALAPALVLLAAAPALVGCAATAVEEDPASEHRETARERALAWDEDAELVRVIGVEGRSGETFGGVDRRPDDGTLWTVATEDGTVGDGHAHVWAYRFVGEDEADVLQVGIQRGEIVSAEVRSSSTRTTPIPEDVIDSPEAADLAREGLDSLDRGLGNDEPGLTLQLLHEEDEGRPVWRVAGGGSGVGGAVVVDAVTGEVVETYD
jgi:hypothetical protein